MSQKEEGRKKKKGGLKSLLFEEESGEEQDEETTEDQSELRPVFTSRQQGAATSPSFTSVFTPAGNADPAVVADVEQLLSAENPSAYTQFEALLASQANIPDESVRFTAAVNAAPLLKLDLSMVRTAYSERLNILDKLRKDFETQSERRLQEKVSSVEAEATRLDTEIGRANTEIQRLQAEIQRQQARVADLQRQREEKTSSISQERERNNKIRQETLAAFDVVRAKVLTERDNVSRYIQG